MELHDHQKEAVEKLRNGSVLVGGVGVGKTFTALAYYVQKVCGGFLDRSEPMRTPKNLFVITTAKKRDDLDWESEALHMGVFRDPEVSYDGVSITVDSWNNIQKYVDIENAFFIFDEQKVVGAGPWVKAFYKIAKANEWILLSATPADTWMDYIPIFVAHGFYRNRTEFIAEHVIWSFHGTYRKIRGFYGVTRLRELRDSILVEMPYDRHTTRHLIAEEVEYDVHTFDRVWKKRWNVYTDEPLLDAAEMHRVGRKVVNSDPSRLKAVVNLMKKHPRLIIFYNFDYELEILRSLEWLNQPSLNSGHLSPDTSLNSSSDFPSAITNGTSSLLDTDSDKLPSVPMQPTRPSPSTSKTSSVLDPTQNASEECDPSACSRSRRSEESSSTDSTSPSTGSTPSAVDSGGEKSSPQTTSLKSASTRSSQSGSTRRMKTSSERSSEMRSLKTSDIETLQLLLKKQLISTPDLTGFELKEWNGHKHDPLPTSDRWVYLVQYQAGAEGWNCITTDAVAYYSLTYSHKIFEQTQGRIDRMNTLYTDLWYYILISNSKIDKLIWKAQLAKKNFHEGRNIKF